MSYYGTTYWQLLWNNLRARPIRTVLSVLGVALQVTFVLLIVGMTLGWVNDWQKRVEGVGADILFQPPNASIFIQIGNAVLPESLAENLQAVSGVDEVSPVLVIANQKTLDIVYGIDFKSFNALSKGFVFVSGGPFANPDDVMVDDLHAAKHHLRVGDKVEIFNREMTVCGVVRHGKGARSFIPLATAQEIAGAEHRVTLFYVRSTGKTEATRQEIVRSMPGYQVRSMQDYLTLMNSSNLPGMKPFLRVMIILGVSISFLVVLLTMHTMVLERTREIGVLKALGASRLEIARLFVAESSMMAAMGVAIGLTATFLARAFLGWWAPGLAVLLTLDWIANSVGLAFLGALLGALYPAWRASGFDPVEALAFE
ncbi:MAG TPA: FtsX-like permease family protein [Candidatus Acidoferrales bacterium]|nr:FtsX-like permease family protein [Candidatus Acidoferrales bacterium]